MASKGDPVMLEIHHPDGRTAQIGTWSLPGELINNYDNQRDVGWYVFHALLNGATKVEFRVGQPIPSDATDSGSAR